MQRRNIIFGIATLAAATPQVPGYGPRQDARIVTVSNFKRHKEHEPHSEEEKEQTLIERRTVDVYNISGQILYRASQGTLIAFSSDPYK